MMGVKNWLRKKVRPTWEEQQERMARQEKQRQGNYEKLDAKLDHQLKSLTRQEALAKKQRKIARIQKKLHPQQKVQGSILDADSVVDALNPPKRKRR